AATGNKGVDVLIDSVGGASAQANFEATAILGRIVSVGRLGGNTGEIDLDLLAYKRAKLIGVTFRTRTKEERIACVQRCAQDLLPALAEGRIGPVVHEVFPLAKIAAAHEAMERNEHLGKIVIELA
ncbi:MAG: zinc-binding dehydrogenase, partial [Betaproteobacteria bacterium]|nr:zinc-binding dehydrogenase [Betaproteobacteria bacterium]